MAGVVHRFTIPVLRVRVLVCLHQRESEALPFIDKHTGNRDKWEDVDQCAGFAFAKHRRLAIWLGPQIARPQVFHECHHGLMWILRELGCSGEDEELNCHIVEFLFERVLNIWEQHRQQNNKSLKPSKNTLKN